MLLRTLQKFLDIKLTKGVSWVNFEITRLGMRPGVNVIQSSYRSYPAIICEQATPDHSCDLLY